MTLDGELVCNIKRPLTVKEGERGLRQSDAVFAHTVNIPALMEELSQYLDMHSIYAVGIESGEKQVLVEELGNGACRINLTGRNYFFNLGTGTFLFP